jgi:hypothetical protein
MNIPAQMMRKVRNGNVGGTRNAATKQPPRTPISKIAMNRTLDMGFFVGGTSFELVCVVKSAYLWGCPVAAVAVVARLKPCP